MKYSSSGEFNFFLFLSKSADIGKQILYGFALQASFAFVTTKIAKVLLLCKSKMNIFLKSLWYATGLTQMSSRLLKLPF
jgi:hypothetical protein